MPGTFLTALPTVAYLNLLLATLLVRFYYISHFVDGETEAPSVHKLSKITQIKDVGATIQISAVWLWSLCASALCSVKVVLSHKGKTPGQIDLITTVRSVFVMD